MALPGGFDNGADWDDDEDDFDAEELKKRFEERMSGRYRDEDGVERDADIFPGTDSGADPDTESDIPDAEVVSEGGEGAQEEKIPEPVSEYLRAIEKWRDEDTLDNAFEIDNLREKRQRKIKEIVEGGWLGHEALATPELRKYISADIAEMSPTSVRDGEYATYVERRANFREILFGEDTSIYGDDAPQSSYIRAVLASQTMLGSPEIVADEYDILDIRREAVQEHFDDPVFVAQVALESGAKGGIESYQDELLFDLDREDLNEKVGKKRSIASADVFSEVAENGKAKERSAARVSDFLRLQGMASEMVTDQSAVMAFARKTNGFDDGEKNVATFNVGMAALKEEKFSVASVQSFWNSFGERAAEVENLTKSDPVKMFLMARKKFDEDFEAGNGDIAASFAVMEGAAKKVHRMGDVHVRRLAEEDLEGFEVLQQFRNGAQEEVRKTGSTEFSEAVFRSLESNGSLRSTRTEIEKTEEDVARVVAEDGRTVQFEVRGADSPDIRVVDGAHLAMSYRNAGFARGDGVKEIEDKIGSSFEDPEVMRSFIADESGDFSRKLSGSGVTSEMLQEAGLPKEVSQKLLAGEASRGERVVAAFSMGLGENVLNAAGVDAGVFRDLSEGKADAQEVFDRLRHFGVSNEAFETAGAQGAFGGDAMKTMGLDLNRLREIQEFGTAEKGAIAYRGVVAKDVLFRLEGMSTPPRGMQTGDGRHDAGQLAMSRLQSILNKNGLNVDGGAALDFEFGRSQDDSENTVSVKLKDGRFLSDVMLQEGFALPVEGEARSRKEKLAQAAEARKKGLWAHGFPENDGSWRRDAKVAVLGALDKGENLFNTIAASMAGNPSNARRILEAKETHLFALPLEEWANVANVDREIATVVKSNPAKIRKIYDNNMEILRDLRERNKKGGLTEDEKLAHDRLSVGRRAMAQGLVEYGHMTMEEAVRDNHKLLSRKSTGLSNGFRDKFAKTVDASAETGARVVKTAGRGAKTVIQAAADFAYDS